jgi:hypothetical protein
MNRHESEHKTLVRCHGIDAKPYTCRVANPEKPGEYCFPPLASLITGAARLMLALLEQSVSTLGGTYAMEDTDSMAIVATKEGGLVHGPGGPHQMGDGSAAVKALSWKQVDELSERFKGLRPYDSAAISGSILKVEDDNFDPQTGKNANCGAMRSPQSDTPCFYRTTRAFLYSFGRGSTVLATIGPSMVWDIC